MLKMDNICFKDEEHRDFFQSMCQALGSHRSVYHQALFYLLGLTDDTRRNYEDIYSFESHGILPDGLYRSWQTGTTMRLTRLAFNLYNGWCEEEHEIRSSPYYLVDCDLSPYFSEAIKLRYPGFSQYC